MARSIKAGQASNAGTVKFYGHAPRRRKHIVVVRDFTTPDGQRDLPIWASTTKEAYEAGREAAYQRGLWGDILEIRPAKS